MDLQNKDKINADKQNTPSTNVHEGHRERMRQRLANGDLDSYQTHEIVEMMLYQARVAQKVLFAHRHNKCRRKRTFDGKGCWRKHGKHN